MKRSAVHALVIFGSFHESPSRSAEALEKLYSEHPNVARIVQALEQIEGIEIIPDGVGNSFLRVRLTGPDAPYDHFLAIYAPFNASYVCWQDQPDTLPEFCRVLWKPYVKNASNSNGSNLRKDVYVEDVIDSLVAMLLIGVLSLVLKTTTPKIQATIEARAAVGNHIRSHALSATRYVIDRMQHYRTHPEVLPEEITQSLARRLRLTAEQQSEVLKIISHRHARIEEARQVSAPEIHSEFDLMEQEVAAVLEERQKEQWLATAEWVRSSFLPLNPQASEQ